MKIEEPQPLAQDSNDQKNFISREVTEIKNSVMSSIRGIISIGSTLKEILKLLIWLAENMDALREFLQAVIALLSQFAPKNKTINLNDLKFRPIAQVQDIINKNKEA